MESRIQSYLRIAASHQRETAQIGSFLATFSPSSDDPFLNYAIPNDNAKPSPAEVNALIVAYEQRSRQPRLEYVSQLAPAVEMALLDAGFCVEGNLPLMTCIPGSEQILLGAGVCTVPSDGTTEIAGIGVRAAFRRRGVAGAIVSRLLQTAVAAGVEVPFLMAAHEAEARIYQRAGFSEIGKILHISHPQI